MDTLPTQTTTSDTDASSPTPTNLYPWLRRLFFVGLILLGILAILALVYYNGKSIYDNGL
jgi:hypothetical protein